MTAKRIFSGRLALIPKARKTSWKSNVNRILEDAMVEVSEAPILLSPMTYKPKRRKPKISNSQFLDMMLPFAESGLLPELDQK
jgi:hypothetical protein